VSTAVVWAYLSALGGAPALLVLLAGFVGTELLRVGATVWLSVWTGAAIVLYCVGKNCHCMESQLFV
jgi:hypothetical protein